MLMKFALFNLVEMKFEFSILSAAKSLIWKTSFKYEAKLLTLSDKISHCVPLYHNAIHLLISFINY